MQSKYILSRRAFLRWSLGASTVAGLTAACSPSNRLATPDVTQAVSTAAPVQANTSAPATAIEPTNPTVLPVITPTFVPTSATLAATPSCHDGDEDLTVAQTEGPYYTPSTPAKTNFVEAGMTGTRMTVSGFVLTTGCKPVAKALLDMWHCDADGVYDNTGYRLRGHFFTDVNGYYKVETIMPGLYTGRTRHFHVKVQAPNQSVLTTQLYFPNEPQNATDNIFSKECLMDITDNADSSKSGAFNFVV